MVLRRSRSMKTFSEKYPEAWALKWEVEKLREIQGQRAKGQGGTDAETDDRD